MVKLKKYRGVLKHFVIILTLFFIVSCANKNFQLVKTEGKSITITGLESDNEQIETYIKPFREHIKKDLDSVLAYCPVTLDKNDGKWQSTIGNLMANVTLAKGNLVFNTRENKQIDICILNSGGIRAVLPKGNVTARNAFEIMPFENTIVVVVLKGEQIFELVDYFIKTQKPHPLSGIKFTITKDKIAKNIMIQGKEVQKDTLYYVATNDYLANGGDNMGFLKKGIKKYNLEYKLRNVLIDYFKEVDTIPVVKEVIVSLE
jgi:2',3'-cyclic-nucleotide 2'-phosphodiesterase (5'-nucleotidase family)